MKRFAITVLAVAAVSGALASGASASKSFQSPSQNIGCLMTGKFVGCEIHEHSYPNPPKPHPCHGDYDGGVVGLETSHKAHVDCASGELIEPSAPVLAYGNRIDNHAFRCASKTKGMRCVNRQTRHGFFISRADLRLF
jgi:hypothetical protein